MSTDQQLNVVLPLESQLLQKCDVNFTSYEDIKREVRQHIEATYSEFTPKAVCKELPDAFIVKGRMNYVIKPISSTRFSVSSYFPSTPCRYGCSYWNYMEMLHDELCEYLVIKYETELEKHEEIEEDEFVEPADHELVYTQTVKNFTSREVVKNALKYAIKCSYNQRTYDEPYVEDCFTKEVPDSCLRIKRFVNNPTKFKIYLYQPKNETYINPEFNPSNLIYYIEDYLEVDREEETTGLEGEAYCEKQFEDYLRLNPEANESEAEDSRENLEDDVVVTSNEVEEAQENTLLKIEEDIYVYDEIDIYE